MTGDGGPALVLGTFPAERGWTPPDQARLPAMPGMQPSQAVAGMDQLLAGVCRAEDVLLTRQAVHPALRDHLRSIGLGPRFHAALRPWDGVAEDGAADASTGELWLRRGDADSALPARPVALRPYAVDAWTGELARRLGLRPLPPELPVVREVNSKIFSTRLADELGVGYGGIPVASAAGFFAAADRLLAGGAVVVKEEHGVSGQGSLVISDPRRLERLRRHFEAQEGEGRRVAAVVEPLMPRRGDFSCHLEITPEGEFAVLGLQMTVNRGFNYSASRTMPADEQAALLDSSYGRVMEAVGRRLAHSGYHGFACVDSMRIEGDGIVPIVEINARMSMGLINHHLGAFFRAHGMGSLLTYLPVSSDRPVDVDRMMPALGDAGLLFTPSNPRGIVPLASGTLPVVRPADHDPDEPLRGRLYFAAGLRDGTAFDEVAAAVTRVLDGLGIRTPSMQ